MLAAGVCFGASVTLASGQWGGRGAAELPGAADARHPALARGQCHLLWLACILFRLIALPMVPGDDRESTALWTAWQPNPLTRALVAEPPLIALALPRVRGGR